MCVNFRCEARQPSSTNGHPLNRTPTDSDIRQAPAPTDALLAEPTSIGVGLLERGAECLKHGALASSHGSFLHVAAHQTLEPSAPLHYISRDHPNAHEIMGSGGGVAGQEGRADSAAEKGFAEASS